MPKEFDDIVNAIKRSLSGKKNPRTGKAYSEDEIYAMATTAYKKKYGKNPSEGVEYSKSKSNWNVFEYSVPIEIGESAEVKEGIVDDHLVVKGTAINETITRNNVKYTADELREAAKTLSNKPILKNHWNDVDSIVGRTTENIYFDEASKSIKFEGKVMEEKYAKMIKDGRITNVSIGAMVKELVKTEEEGADYLIAKGLEFVELSLVPVPGDASATIGQALAEAYDYKQAVEFATKEQRGETMAEDEVKPDVPAEEPKEEPVEAPKEEPVEEPKEEPAEEPKEEPAAEKTEVIVKVEGLDEIKKVATENATLMKENEGLKKKVKEMEETKETKGKVEKPKVSEDFGHYMIETDGRKGELFIMPNPDGTFPKRGE